MRCRLFRFYSALIVLALAACVPPKPHVVPPPVTPPPVAQPYALHVETHVAGAQGKLQIVPGSPLSTWLAATADANGHIVFTGVPASTQLAHLVVSAEGYVEYSASVPVARDATLSVTLQPAHFDPSTLSLQEVARIRGAMWTARLDLDYGPRPKQPTNILATTELHIYPPAEQLRMIAALKARGYTHVVMGPWFPGGDQGYHAQYPEVAITWDAWLDLLQLLWDNGLAPVVFCKPDNWTIGQLETLTPYYAQPRAQRLVRIAVPGGWEPSMDTSNAEWVRWVQWGARVLPNALRLIHMAPDFDAPGNDLDFTEYNPAVYNGDGSIDLDRSIRNPQYIGMAKAWARVAPSLHAYLMQTGGYAAGRDLVPSEQFKRDFCGLFNPAGGRESIASRFERGVAGWPTSSAWGPDKGLLLYAGEYAAFISYWRDAPETYSVALGDLAMSCGAAGYMDGGSVAVPAVKR